MFVFSIFRCPVDWEIMGEFEYSSSKTTALVHFQAHKFPYTSSVYYQCNVRLCIRHAGGCEDTVSEFFLSSLPPGPSILSQGFNNVSRTSGPNTLFSTGKNEKVLVATQFRYVSIRPKALLYGGQYRWCRCAYRIFANSFRP